MNPQPNLKFPLNFKDIQMINCVKLKKSNPTKVNYLQTKFN